MTRNDEFDLAVIGTGGAAMSAAIHARLEGASVVAIESEYASCQHVAVAEVV